MKRILLLGLPAALFVLVLLSCPTQEDLSHRMTIVNNSSIEVQEVDLWYTGVKMAAPDSTLVVSVPAGNTKIVELTMDASSNYYRMQISNNTLARYIYWYQTAPDSKNVLLSKGGSSTCTITQDQLTCFAGENHVNPASHSWVP